MLEKEKTRTESLGIDQKTRVARKKARRHENKTRKASVKM
jgi:hypothetical protein